MAKYSVVDKADDFMWEVAEILGRLDLTHRARFQEFCANLYGFLTPELAAEEWFED